MDKLDNKLSFGTKCRMAGIRRDTAKYYKKAHPELTDDEVIMHYVNKQKTFRDKCREAGINTGYGEKYKYAHRELTDDEVIQCILNNRNNTKKTNNDKKSNNRAIISKKYREELNQLCNSLGVNYASIRDYRRRHPNLTNEQIIYRIKSNNDRVSFRKKCDIAGVRYDGARHYKDRHPELTDEEVIEIYKTKKPRVTKYRGSVEKSFRQKCIDNGINYRRAIIYRNRHEELDDDTVINLYKVHNNTLVINNEESIQRCKLANINRRKFTNYRRLHPELTEEQIILHFNPRCYMNIFGELVIPEES